MARIQGTVRMRVLVGPNGTVKHEELISGHPLLADAALKGVSRWRYRPAVSGGKDKEVAFEVDVTFELDNH